MLLTELPPELLVVTLDNIRGSLKRHMSRSISLKNAFEESADTMKTQMEASVDIMKAHMEETVELMNARVKEAIESARLIEL